MDYKPESANRDSHRWVVFGAISLVYFLVYFHRVSTSVIVDDLAAAFRTNATALGFMSSMYFYLYAFEQPLVGYFTDRLGPRRLIGFSSIIAAAGCFLFGLAPTIAWASAGRALIGIGVGGVYVPALKALALWFSTREFAGMLGLLMSIGNLGAVIATTPLAWAAGTWGWRPTFHLIGAVTLALSLCTLFGTRDHHALQPVRTPGPTGGAASHGGLGSDILRVLSSWTFWLCGLIFFGVYGTMLTLQGLWATPFLMSALGIERMLASKLNMLIPIGVIIGSPLFGWLSGRISMNKYRTLIGIVAGLNLTWAALIFLHAPLGATGLALVQLAMGVCAGGFLSIFWSIVKEATDPSILGLTLGLMNPAPFLGVAAFQVVTGIILDQAGETGGLYSLAGFERAFMVCLAANLFCLVLAYLVHKGIPGKRMDRF
ncbi:MAG: MFS transporter [Desulfobacteraceae bacterium]|nr:MAG: MFS transporter [Desulfobacteraceae bacterium]